MSNVATVFRVSYKGCLNLFTPMSAVRVLVSFRALLAKGCSFFPEKCLLRPNQVRVHFVHDYCCPLSFADVRLVTAKNRNDDSC
jgi:hypothetical protein